LRKKSPDDFLDLSHLLGARWRTYEREGLEAHLRQLILAECRTRPTNSHFDPLLPAYRFRARRKEVARRFVELGGTVSHCVLSGTLPQGRHWPGIVRLVQTPGFELFP
jgi:hypothetical protein